MNEHEKYMKRALELAVLGRGFVNPNPMVGAVIVKDGRIISEGWHHSYGELHAERDAFENLKEDCHGADLYVTLEPCCHHGKQPPCTDAIIKRGIKRVFAGSDDPNPAVNGGGYDILKKNGIEVHRGILKEECDSINRHFFHYIKNRIPYTVCKYAMTADGKIATRTGDSKWISGEASRRYVHELRGTYRGIMVGINTVLKDDPMLNCRIENRKSPVRIVCDSSLRLPLESRLVKTAGQFETIAATVSQDSEKISALEKRGVKVIVTKNKDGRTDLADLYKKLGSMGIDSILAEGGGELDYSLMKEGLCNRLLVFVAPKIFGGRNAKTPVGGEGAELAKDCLRLSEPVVRLLDGDVLLDYEVM